MSSLRLETEFILSDLHFSKWDDKGILGISCDAVSTKFIGQLAFWRRTTTGQLDLIQSTTLPTGGTACKESSKYSSFIHTAHTDPVLRLWTRNNLEKPIKRYTFHNMSVEDIDVSPFDGEEFVSCSKDASFAVWTMTDSEPIYAFSNEASFPIQSVRYHTQNPSLLLVAPLDAKIELYNTSSRTRVYTMIPSDDILFSSMSLNPYNEFALSVADETGKVYIWDLRRLKKPVHHFQAHGLAISNIEYNPHDERLLGTGSTDGYFHLWYINENGNEQCLKSFKNHHLPITTWNFSVHDLGLVGDASSDYSLFLWNCLKKE